MGYHSSNEDPKVDKVNEKESERVHWCHWMSNTLLKHIVVAVIFGGILPAHLLDIGVIVINKPLVLVTFFVDQDVVLVIMLFVDYIFCY